MRARHAVAKPRHTPMAEQQLLRVVTKMLFPFIVMFAVYVQTHGEVGPGGGFQAGVLLASAFILYGIVFGADKLRQKLPTIVTDVGMALGCLIYAGTGLHNMLAGSAFLDFGMLDLNDAGGSEALGLVLIEYGVGITVSSVMITIYMQIASRPERLTPAEQAQIKQTKAEEEED